MRKNASIWVTILLMLVSSVGIQEFGAHIGNCLILACGSGSTPSADAFKGQSTPREAFSGQGEWTGLHEFPTPSGFPAHDREMPGLPEEAKIQRSASSSANDVDHFLSLSPDSNSDMQSFLRESTFVQLGSSSDLLHSLHRLQI